MIEAKIYKLIPRSKNLAVAARILETIHHTETDTTLREFPRICIDDERPAKILSKSLEMEKILMPDWFSSENGGVAIERDFKTFTQMKLCGVDVIRVVKGNRYSDMWKILLNRI